MRGFAAPLGMTVVYIAALAGCGGSGQSAAEQTTTTTSACDGAHNHAAAHHDHHQEDDDHECDVDESGGVGVIDWVPVRPDGGNTGMAGCRHVEP